MPSILDILWKNLGSLLQLFGIVQFATDFTNVQYLNDQNEMLYGHLALPSNYDANATTPYPLALVFHAWNGMADEPVYFADLLANDAGYVAFAPDLFRGVRAQSALFPWNIFTVSVTPQDRMDADIDTALAYLEENYNVDVSNVVSGPGFCFGGSQALELSKRRNTRATVTLYGASISELQDPTAEESVWGLLGAEDAPILGIYGADDMAPSPEDVRGFEEALEARGAIYNITIYDGVGHAFVNPEAHQSGDEPAVQAWDQVMEFMTSLTEGSLSDTKWQRRRDVQIVKTTPYRPSRSWLWDHMMDYQYHKGHANPHQGAN